MEKVRGIKQWYYIPQHNDFFLLSEIEVEELEEGDNLSCKSLGLNSSYSRQDAIIAHYNMVRKKNILLTSVAIVILVSLAFIINMFL
jgi:hypothetical protein